jgi:hypothetical protein
VRRRAAAVLLVGAAALAAGAARAGLAAGTGTDGQSLPSGSASAAVPGEPPAVAPSESGAPPPPISDRSYELLRLDCANRLGRREVTLFGNGTIRLRDGPLGKEWMGLAELGPEEMQAVLRRLANEDLEGSEGGSQGVAGDWIERCDLQLDLPGKPQRRISFGRYDALPLAVSKVRGIADELGAKVRNLNDTDRLPTGYEPQVGDVLKRADGNRYRIVMFTADGKGVELDGLEQPLRLIVLKEQMRLEFVALLAREP